MKNVLRRPVGNKARVAPAELFLDLVFVFAVTQLSHTLLHDLTITGALHTAILFLGVWWMWVFTAWATNWVDPDTAPVRLMLFALTTAGLFVSMAIPQAFEGQRSSAVAPDRSPNMTIRTLAAQQGRCSTRMGKLMRLGWLAPRIVEAIASGEQPARLPRGCCSLPSCRSAGRRSARSWGSAKHPQNGESRKAASETGPFLRG